MDDLALIRLVKSNALLYDKSHKYYKCIEMRKEAWERIASELGADETICTRRWVAIRDRFTRASRRLTALIKDGITVKQISPLFKEMEFLKPHIVARCTSIFKGPTFSLRLKEQSTLFNPDSFITDQEDTTQFEEVTEPFQFMNSASNTSEQEIEEEEMDAFQPTVQEEMDAFQSTEQEEIDAFLPTDTLSSSAPCPEKPNSNKRDEPKASHLPATKSMNQHTSSRKRRYESDIEQELSAALEMFKRVCKCTTAHHKNHAVHGFGQMIVETICGMSERKQAIAMQKVTEVVMNLKIQPESM